MGAFVRSRSWAGAGRPAKGLGAHSGRHVPAFVLIVTAAPLADTDEGCAVSVGQAAQRTRSVPCIEIRLASAVMRVSVETDDTLLTEVL